MAQATYVIAYEGDEDGTRVLDFAIRQAKAADAKLLIIHVLEWSPYQFLTPEEVEERHGRRKQEIGRAQKVILDPAMERANKAGVEAEARLPHGSVVPLVDKAAREAGASMIFVGRSGASSLGARIFGSVPLGLAQIATIPTVIIP